MLLYPKPMSHVDLSIQLHQKLFAWWSTQGRILPWREKISMEIDQAPAVDENSFREHIFATYFASSARRDPYRVVVAEMMLQQTQVDRVFQRYQAWMKKWPTVEDLAQANLSDVIIFWQGLGYNRRARFLWLLAKQITQERHGIWPTTESELRKLPGIGKYTARAVMSFAFGMQVGVVDTNVKRILQRVVDGDASDTQKSEEYYFQLADTFLPQEKADPWNQSLMDFGALICTAKRPKCEICPLQEVCQANLGARRKSFLNYADFLSWQSKQPNSQIVPKKSIPQFKDTDRFFRGRIIDQLRVNSLELRKLQNIMEHEFGLHDETRFAKLIRSLVQEGLITQEKNQVQLA